MTNADLNEYIKYYIEHDQTRRAIMLTGSWGSGKSYYIQNELIPFLAKEENGKHQCVIVSLYGLKDTIDISKNIYLECRLKRITAEKSEMIESMKLAGTTIIKGISSYFGVDLSKSDENMRKLYESIDLSGKLVVLEDIERSNIDILNILGYANNIVEQDGVKVMLVANEDEIIKYHNSEPDEHGKTQKIYEKRTLNYLKMKEKTVCDTITFSGDVVQAMQNILMSFNCEILSYFSDEVSIEQIRNMSRMNLREINLRTFMYSCQKTMDICQKFKIKDNKYIENIYYSVYQFSETIKESGNFPEWKGDSLLSTELGNSKYPLYRFCYDYIRWQQLDVDILQATFDQQDELRLYDRHGATDDVDLNIIYYYQENYERDVLDALKRIEVRLDDPKDIPLYSYGRLAFNIVKLHTLLKYDYTESKGKMVKNMRGKGDKIDSELLFLPAGEIDDDKQRELFTSFSQEIIESMNFHSEVVEGFSYNPDDIRAFYMQAKKQKEIVFANHAFICKFDLQKLENMLFSCSPSQIRDFRDLLSSFYRYATANDFLEADRTFMEELTKALIARLDITQPESDRIVRLQLDGLIKSLNQFIKQLS